LIDNMASVIGLAPGPTCQLLCGQRGSGKTTEINKLILQLRSANPPYFVIYCETDNYLDINDVEYPDVLLAIAQQLNLDCIKEGIQLSPGKVRSFWDEVKGILGAQVIPTKTKVKAGIMDFEFDIKQSPDNRKKIREHLKPRATRFQEAVNEVILKAADELSTRYAGLVVIVDNLDRVFRNVIPGTIPAQTNHDALFIEASDYLKGVACHVIYTIPPALLYSLNGAKLGPLYGRLPQVLPMVPVSRRTGEEDEAGMKRLEEAVEKRLKRAGIAMKDAFNPETLRRLCTVSGGYLVTLMALMRANVIYSKALPFTLKVLERTINDHRDAKVTALSIKPDRWQILRQVAQKKAPVSSEEYPALLDTLMVLEYRDAEGPWHDVDPIVKEAREFKATAP